MLIQISAGTGPCECERAVALLLSELERELDGALSIVRAVPSRFNKGDLQSALLEIDDTAVPPDLLGTIQWVGESPYRPHHKRKNWFVDASAIPDARTPVLDNADVAMSFFHCGGKGGQNVNKVETGVRLVHVPTGVAVEADGERTQEANRRAAAKKMAEAFAKMESDARAGQRNEMWRAHNELERGNPVRVYKGEKFKRVR